MKKNILITLDYEIFLGNKSGSVDKCLIEPTNLFLESIEIYNCICIFFVDCTYLLKLKEYSIKYKKINDDYQKIISQLKYLVSKGHYVYPHIHTHWIDATYDHNINQWDLSNIEHYRFSSLSKKRRETIFKKSCSLLLEIIQTSKRDYVIEGFRAGGWCIQPFSNFANLFRENNIVADFSVLAGSKKHTNAIKFDFSKVPTNTIPYSFSDNECIEDASGQFKEYPISSINIKKYNFLNWVIDAFLWRTKYGRSIGDGHGVPFINYENETNYDKNMEMVSIELLTIYKLQAYKHYLMNNNYIHFISHPKMISHHNISNFKKLLKFSTKNYDVNFDWKKIQINS